MSRSCEATGPVAGDLRGKNLVWVARRLSTPDEVVMKASAHRPRG